ncbi:MAG: hypothetical protein U1E51_27245 [Candidatus Binatia bacterium]|nr:hypothetical protein [Candidatus Binatia bacterium]
MKKEYTETPSTCPYCLVDGKALVAQVAAWKKAIEGLTPSGSEYVDDPERCATYIRDRFAGPKMVRDLREQVAELREALEDLRTMHAQFHGGHFDACACKEWSKPRAALEATKGQP